MAPLPNMFYYCLEKNKQGNDKQTSKGVKKGCLPFNSWGYPKALRYYYWLWSIKKYYILFSGGFSWKFPCIYSLDLLWILLHFCQIILSSSTQCEQKIVISFTVGVYSMEKYFIWKTYYKNMQNRWWIIRK